MIKASKFGLAGLLVLLGAGTAKADLVVNGSFEAPTVGGNYGTYTNGQVQGWTSNNNEQEIDSSSLLGLPNYAGTQNTELNGNTFDTISQTFTTLTPGQRYLLTWGYAGRDGSGPQQMNVLFNNLVVATNTSAGATAWNTYSAVVTATTGTQTLSFAAINVGGNPAVGNELDGVTLNAYVPEPASAALLGAGILGLAAWRRRRSTAAA